MLSSVLLPPFETGMMWSNSRFSRLPHLTHLPSSRSQTSWRSFSGIRFLPCKASFLSTECLAFTLNSSIVSGSSEKKNPFSNIHQVLCPSSRSILGYVSCPRVRASRLLAPVFAMIFSPSIRTYAYDRGDHTSLALGSFLNMDLSLHQRFAQPSNTRFSANSCSLQRMAI